MDIDKFLAKIKRVAGTTKVETVKIDYLDHDYKIEEFSNNQATNTGLVKIAQLSPKNSHFPVFLFRWDEGKEELDVDIYKNEQQPKELWNEKEYKGHHTEQVAGEGKIFKANISIPNKKIFEGKINVGLFVKLTIKDSIKLKDSIEIVHKKVDIKDTNKGIESVKIINK